MRVWYMCLFGTATKSSIIPCNALPMFPFHSAGYHFDLRMDLHPSNLHRMRVIRHISNRTYTSLVTMSNDAEQQADEIEVLKSIYEGDDNFKQVDATTYQYKYADGDKSFILEILWGPTYPTEKPQFNLDIFYNQHLLPEVKKKILDIVDTEAEQWIGCAMTYTLFEALKEKVTEILAAQTEEAVLSARVEKIVVDDQNETKKPTEKKEQLTKSQKRRAWDRAEMGRGGEKPRGWDWVDIVKHLSQVPHQTTS